ncbi:LysR family transcriptional regulator [Paracidovorax anthurii]|uniref:DNA-binding transcriptional LysR family regulator n=1 Tax=Paracidovorax anthurii TaxID=78229 RepID=A0A328ZL33_9BURK|nr:LysR substrate-binding domain-containing protein [Paracidovorax anthurii]RAR86579.1 DNA-binding transcriptional LysR family regulator [Paracidovorax anthurii]
MDWTHRLRLRHLQMLLSLAQTGNMSRSAQALNTAQPALSKWLKELEEDIGVPLFERHARGLKPTAQGEALIAHARRVEAHLDSARDDMHALREGGSGLVVVGTSGASASDVVPMAVLRLLEWLPRARIRLAESTMNVLMQQLATGELDVVVGRSAPELHDTHIHAEMLYMEPIHLVARPQHPLFRQPGEPGWDDLMAYRWLVWPRGTPIRNALENALATAGHAVPRDTVESNSVTLNLTLLGHSDMIGMASHRAALRFSQLGALRVLPVRLSGFGSVSMYWRENTTDRAAVASMLRALREVAASAPAP